MTKTLRQTAFLFDCVMFFVTYVSLFALPVVGSVWWAATTFPSLGSNTVVLSLDMTIYLTLLFSAAALFGSLAGGLRPPWKD